MLLLQQKPKADPNSDPIEQLLILCVIVMIFKMLDNIHYCFLLLNESDINDQFM